MDCTAEHRRSVLADAKRDLKPFQQNITAKLVDGSELRAIWEGCRFVDFARGEPMPDVVDFWIDHSIPEGGFETTQYGLAL